MPKRNTQNPQEESMKLSPEHQAWWDATCRGQSADERKTTSHRGSLKMGEDPPRKDFDQLIVKAEAARNDHVFGACSRARNNARNRGLSEPLPWASEQGLTAEEARNKRVQSACAAALQRAAESQRIQKGKVHQ